LRSRGGRMRVEKDGQLLLGLNFQRVRQIVIFGRAGLTTPLLQQCLARSIDVTFLSAGGSYFGRLQGDFGTDPKVRRAQFRCSTPKAPERLEIARRMVAGKLVNQRTLLQRSRRAHHSEQLEETIARIDKYRRQLPTMQAVDAIMGIEGAAAREYFRGFDSLLQHGWRLEARRRRPPPDPVNSALSLGYALLTQEAIAAANAAGLDPFAGFLHTQRAGQPTLGFDLVEEFRPVIVDSVVLRLFNTRAVNQDSFSIETGPPVNCSMTDEGRKVFLAAYERRMLTLFTHQPSGRRVSYRVGLFLQARSLALELTGGHPYVPIQWK
jgi:CRISP-associated protein Cas1